MPYLVSKWKREFSCQLNINNLHGKLWKFCCFRVGMNEFFKRGMIGRLMNRTRSFLFENY